MPLRFILEGIAELVFELVAETAKGFLYDKLRSNKYNQSDHRTGYRKLSLKKRIKIYQSNEVEEPAIIIEKPELVFTRTAIRIRKPGIIRLKAILGKDGSVRHIQPIQGLDSKLTKAAIDAARRIRFQPARIGGFPVSQWVELEYRFDET